MQIAEIVHPTGEYHQIAFYVKVPLTVCEILHHGINSPSYILGERPISSGFVVK